MAVENLVKECYSIDVKREWNRLVKDPFHLLEFETTKKYIKKYLPKKGRILDAGGGPGRYSIWLAQQGYDVVLLDITPANIEFAKKKIKQNKVQNKIDAVVGDITDLSRFENNAFDVVLCLGAPLSHVGSEKQRKKAISELIRVAKKNAPVLVSVIGKLGVMANAPMFWANEISDTKHFRRLAEKGDDYRWHGKYYAHLFTKEELENLFSQRNFSIKELIGLEGISYPSRTQINALYKKDKLAWKNWLEAHYKTCNDPSVVGMSLHILVVGKKK